jgi:PAS domain S-box-containing protein
LVVATALFATSCLSVATLYQRASAAYIQQVGQWLVRQAQATAALLDGDLHATLVRPEQEGSPEYERAVEPLRRVLRAVSGLRFAYTMVLRGDGVYFVLDATPQGDADGDGVEDHSFLMERYERPEPPLLLALRSGKAVADVSSPPDKRGAVASGYAPLFDSRGRQVGIVGIDIDFREYRQQLGGLRRAALLATVPAGLMSVLLGLITYGLRARAARAEIERSRMESMYREEQRAMSALLSNLPGLACRCRCDGNWTMLFVSEGCVELTGYLPGDLLHNRRISYEQIIHPEDRGMVRAKVEAAVRSKEPFRLTYRIVTAGGEEKWVWAQGRGVYAPTGELMFLEGFITDITERKRAEAALRQAMRSAEAGSRAKTEFLANMSHEVRTPMTAILGYAEQLLDGNLPEPERTQAIHTIRRNAVYLLEILNDVLDLSKIEAGQLELEHVPCSPAAVVLDVCTLLQHRAQEKGLELRAEFPEPIPATIQTDPTRLRQILINLVGNAIKFTDRGFVRVVTRLVQPRDGDMPGAGRERGGPFMQFDVIDSGIGIPPDRLARLFQPFSQADSSTSRRFGGTGLGLAISRRLARKLGGDVEIVATRPGAGTHIRVTVRAGPLQDVEMVQPKPEEMRPEVPVAAPQPPPLQLVGRVLLAEDGIDNQRLIAQILRRAGLTVAVAADGRAALEQAITAWRNGEPFDLILMDMQMPEMDGYQATRLLRQYGYPGIIVALTAHALAQDREKCLAVGCNDYMSKPIERAALLELVRRHLASAQEAVSAQAQRAPNSAQSWS